jgi:hypothetical protein
MVLDMDRILDKETLLRKRKKLKYEVTATLIVGSEIITVVNYDPFSNNHFQMDMYCEQFCCIGFLICKSGATITNYLKEKDFLFICHP